MPRKKRGEGNPEGEKRHGLSERERRNIEEGQQQRDSDGQGSTQPQPRQEQMHHPSSGGRGRSDDCRGDNRRQEKEVTGSNELARGSVQEKGKVVDDLFVIIFLNARSILSKLDVLNILINDEKPHILCITETWLNPNISNAILNMPNYVIDDELRKDRTDTARGIGGGLLAYYRNDIVVQPKIVDNDFNQFCSFQVLNNNEEPLNIKLIYRSPNSDFANT